MRIKNNRCRGPRTPVRILSRQIEFYIYPSLGDALLRVYEHIAVKFSAVNDSRENNPKPIISFSRYEDMRDYI